MKICLRCRVVKPTAEFHKKSGRPDGLDSWCKACALEYNQAYRKRHREERREKDRTRYRANRNRIRATISKWGAKNAGAVASHSAVYRAVASGRLVKGSCAVCGADAVAHHEDYSKPLEVIWLCIAHHRRLHSRRNERRKAREARQDGD